MDTYEATRTVLSRIQSLDPENASKIMGLLLIQDHGEKEMIRLAFGPESQVHSVVLKARKDLGLASNSPSTPSSPAPFPPNHHHQNHPFSLSRQNSAASRLLKSSCFSEFQNHDDLISPNSSSSPYSDFTSSGFGNSSFNSSASSFYETDLVDEFQLQDQLSFHNEGGKNPDLFYPHRDLACSPTGTGGGGESMLFPPYAAANHRRSCSVSDICLGSDDPAFGFGWKPCLYYARGYCKNGNSCRFLHGGGSTPDSAAVDGGSQLLTASTFPHSALTANKCMSFLLQQQQNVTQRAAAAALMMGEEMNKLGRSRLERNEFLMSPVSRQIYLTFPADSTFREEDVSNYFSIYGPVQDVRIPYQQKRMFGFVTFVYPETVKLILAKGNPHFVCDARVLVKPYKEKGKVPDKYRKQQQMERGEFSACGSPTGTDSRDSYDLQLGGRVFCNSQDLLWRRKMEEQAELQQAIDLQGRRLMGLQLLDVKRPNLHHRALFTGAAAIPSPTHSPNFFNQTVVFPPPFDRRSPEVIEENGYNPAPATVVADQESKQTVNLNEKERESSTANGIEENANGKEISHQREENDLPESLDHNLPDSPFASPKVAANYLTAFNAAGEAEENAMVVSAATAANNHLITSSLISPTSPLDIAPFKSCYFQVPRFPSGHGAIGM